MKIRNDKEQSPKIRGAANSPHFQQEGIVSAMPPQQLFSEEESIEKEEELQNEEKSFADTDGAETPPYDPSNPNEENILNILQQRHKEATKDEKPKQFERFDFKKSLAYQNSLNQNQLTKDEKPKQFERFDLNKSFAYQNSLNQNQVTKDEKPKQFERFDLKKSIAYQNSLNKNQVTKDEKPKQFERFDLKKSLAYQNSLNKNQVTKDEKPKQFERFDLSKSLAYQNSLNQNQETKGKDLPQEVKAKMENTMGEDFSNVNIHKDSKSATDVGALAFAQGNDVHFAPGQFKPDTQSGQELIGHELAHVKQQREGRVKPTTQAKGLPVNDDKHLEKEADDFGKKSAQAKFNPATKKVDTSNLKVALNQNIVQKTGDLAAVLKALENNDWDVDSLAAELSDEQMATISTSNRLRLITNIANGYAVGNEDEQTILRLFATAPTSQVSALVDTLTNKLLERLESVLHGDEYSDYHVLIRKLFFKARSPKEAVEESESALTFPWADPGLIRAVWNERFYYEIAEFTDEGRLRFQYWHNIAFMGRRNKAIEVDPMEMILVHFHDDETEVGAAKNETMTMPAINLLSLVQSQFRGEMQTVADVGFIALGGAGLVGAATRLGRAIAAIELTFGATDILVRDFRAQIASTKQGQEFLAVWDIVSAFAAIYGFSRLVIEGGRIFIRLRRAWKVIKGTDDAAHLGNQVDDVLDQVDEVKAVHQETLSPTPEGTPNTEPIPSSTPENTPSTIKAPTPRVDIRTVPSTIRTRSGVDVAIEADRLEHVLKAHTIENFDPVARAAEIVSHSPTDPTTFFKQGTVTNARELYTLIKQALEGPAGRQVIEGSQNQINLTIRNQSMTAWVGKMREAEGGGMRLNSIYPVAPKQSITAAQVRDYAADITAGTRTLDQIRLEIITLLKL